MRKSEWLIIFYLLQDKRNLNKNIRQLAVETGLSVGSVHAAVKKLEDTGFLIENSGLTMLRKRLIMIERWAKAYTQFKAKYLIARFTFLNQQVRDSWQNIPLPDTLSWGGEPAANLLDGYIQPEQWDVYTADNANALIATGRMIPSPQGEIFVYKRFWKTNGTPALVVYADLLATNDDRCREAAERLKPML